MVRSARVAAMRRSSEPASDAFEAFVSRARAARPDLGGADEAARVLAPQLERTMPEGVELAAYLGGLHAGDLLVASAAADGSKRAIELLRGEHDKTLDRALRSASIDAATAEDAKQDVWERVLIGSDDRAPSILSYSGRGALAAWLSVTVVREALRRKGGSARARSGDADDESEFGIALDGELEYMKRLYTREFRAAFREVLATLSSRDRNLLRYTYVDGISAERVADLYGVHRVSVARWLGAIRTALARDTSRRLEQMLGIQTGDSDSILRLIQSRLDMTLSALSRDG